MESARRSTSSAPVLSLSLQRSLSPTRHFYSSYASKPPSVSSSSTSLDFSAHRSLSAHHGGSAASVNFSLGRSVSPNRNLQSRSPVRSVPLKPGSSRKPVPSGSARKTCMCSPTNHPGSFRCSLHRNSSPSSSSSSGTTNSQLHMRRSAMTNSLVRIGSVEGEWVKRALTALIRPSSHQIRRRMSFQPRPSRLRRMAMAEDFGIS